jgi:hypothetical protein
VGKEDTLPATVIRKRITTVSLGEGITQQEDALKEELQGGYSELRGN